ncbi:MAG: glycosyltransferase [Gammaproteobacteria bacterium]|nr:glycosyltransferase [Gammaproteobacteria bacterium]
MKITQLMLAKGFGGAERLFVDMCIAFSNAGLEVQAICQKGSESADILKESKQINLKTVPILGAWDLFAVRKIQNLLLEHKSELVQAHLARGALLAGRACSKLNLPLIVTTHNYIDPRYYRFVTKLVPPTLDQYNYYLQQGVSPKRMLKIDHFSTLEPGSGKPREANGLIRLRTLGRLVEKKSFDVLIDAVAELAQKEKQEYELHIGGSGPQRKALQAQIDHLGLDTKIKLVGWVKDSQAFLQEGDIFVLPSRDEPFGIVVIEAMAAGVAIVSTDCHGPVEILDENTAWLCKKDDAAALYEAIRSAASSDALRLAKIRQASSKFSQCYSQDAVIPQFIQLYSQVLQEQPKPSPD